MHQICFGTIIIKHPFNYTFNHDGSFSGSTRIIVSDYDQSLFLNKIDTESMRKVNNLVFDSLKLIDLSRLIKMYFSVFKFR